MRAPNFVVPLFVAAWIALGIGGFVFFAFGKDLARRKRLFPRYAVAVSVFFCLFVVAVTPFPMGLLMVPFAALIAWLNIRMTHFCDSCGRMLIEHQWWAKMSYCSHCGTKLSNF